MNNMTSKEAFKELKENAIELSEWELDRLNIIEKDLEVLEIAIKYNIDWEVVEVSESYLIYKANLKSLCFDEWQIPNREEFKMLKERLKNDNIRNN